MSASAEKTIRINPNETTVIIGENGSGKSTLLNSLAKAHSKDGIHVIGIANTIYDKFNLRSSKFSFLGARSGREIAKKSIKRALIESTNDEFHDLKKMSNILNYVGYDGVIGIKVTGLNVKNVNTSNFGNESVFDINSLVYKYLYYFKKPTDSIVWLGVADHQLSEIDKSYFARFIKYESMLKKNKALTSIEIFLRKNGRTIPLDKASSGELSFITSMIYISTLIKINSTILIDEPENSLHPKWQKEYLNKILDLFYFYSPTIVIATHSPLIVSGAENTDSKVTIYKHEGQKFSKFSHKDNDMESLLWGLFEVVTPENRFMSNFLVTTLNDLAERKIKILEVKNRISELEKSCYDERQLNTLKGISEIADRIESRTSNV